jgi:hypothetical protein
MVKMYFNRKNILLPFGEVSLHAEESAHAGVGKKS